MPNLVGVGSRLEPKPNDLTGVQQQRVAMPRALTNQRAMNLAYEMGEERITADVVMAL